MNSLLPINTIACYSAQMNPNRKEPTEKWRKVATSFQLNYFVQAKITYCIISSLREGSTSPALCLVGSGEVPSILLIPKNNNCSNHYKSLPDGG